MVRIKNFVDTQDFTKDELLDMVELGLLIKANLKAGYPLNVLYHKTLGMIFEQAELYYNTPNAVKVGSVSVEEANQYIEEGHFAKGSMLPKIQAAIKFVEATGNKAIITSLTNLDNAMLGNKITEIHK